MGPALLPFVWLGVAVVAGLIEAASPMLVCIWFCLGAAITFVVSFFVDDLLVQIVVFVIASLVMLAALRPFMKKRVNAKGEQRTNSDAYVDRIVTVSQGITETRRRARPAGRHVLDRAARARRLAQGRLEGARARRRRREARPAAPHRRGGRRRPRRHLPHRLARRHSTPP